MCDRAATGTVTPADDLVLWAASEAGRLLTPLGNRWAHTCRVANRAWWAAAGLPRHDRELLVAAAYLHDIGYAPQLRRSGFHPLDGARHLRRAGLHDLAELVAYHSAAQVEAELRGLAGALASFAPPRGPVADALNYCDTTTGPTGATVTPEERFREIVRRHGPTSEVAQARALARPDTYAAVVRTLRRIGRARPSGPFTAETVDLGCTLLVRLGGVLDSEAGDHAGWVLAVALARQPHDVLIDAALLEAATPLGARALLATMPTGLDEAFTVADANARVSTTLHGAGLPPHRLERGITQLIAKRCQCAQPPCETLTSPALS